MQEPAAEIAPNAALIMSGSFATSTKITIESESPTRRKRPNIAKSLSEPTKCVSSPKKKSALRHYSIATTKRAAASLESVKFDLVHIREYPIIPGDNPGALSGVPLTIDWDPQQSMSATVEEYESKRPKRRTAAEFQMPPDVRQALLRKTGFSLAEIQKYQKKANTVRSQRKSTAELSHMANLSEAREKMTRGLSNLTLKRGRKQKERQFIQQTTKTTSTTTSNTTSTSSTSASSTKPLNMRKESSGQLTGVTMLVASDDEETEC